MPTAFFAGPTPRHLPCPASPLQENYPGGKLATYVLSLGRPLYIQVGWGRREPPLESGACCLPPTLHACQPKLFLCGLLQTAWQILDPAGQIIPHKEFSRKVGGRGETRVQGVLALREPGCLLLP